jgi:sulfide:quinone oxidoreductase
VWAIGDVATVPLPGRYKPDVPLVLPKAAVFAQAQAKVVAEQIAAHAQGKECAAAFAGTGFCFVEFGGDHAMGGDADFFALPAPRVTTKVPDLGQFQTKVAWAAAFLQNF